MAFKEGQPPPANSKPFTKGHSGNPAGRPKGLERRVRDLLGDDIDAMTIVLRDLVLGSRPLLGADGKPVLKPDGTPAMEPTPGLNGEKVTTRDRIEAYKVLTDRGWGKARQTVDVSGDLTLGQRIEAPLAPLTEAQLALLAELDVGDREEDPEDDPETAPG